MTQPVCDERFADCARRSCGPAACQPCRTTYVASRGARPVCDRQAHSDRPGEDGGRKAHPSLVSDGEAINPSRQTCVRRPERSTPTNRTGAQRLKDQRQLQPSGLSRGRRPLRQLRRFGPRWLRRACHSASPAFPLGQSPCNRDHAPRFLWSETLEKAKQCNHY